MYKILTETISFKAVSDPILTSLPGRLLEIVDGTQISGIQNSLNSDRFSYNSIMDAYASKPPIINNPFSLCSLNLSAIFL